jgi:H+/Cl- antiporter ClcA
VIRLVPGHAGPDPATTGLVEPPLPLFVLPGLVLALLLTLAGGVSLGPENPIMAINAAVVVVVGRRAVGRVDVPTWMELSIAGTIGAMFGTPVGAALLLSEALAQDDSEQPLWDRLFAPLLAAGAGAITTSAVSSLDLSIAVPDYLGFRLLDIGYGTLIAVSSAALGLAAIYLFPFAHRLFHRVGPIVVMTTIGGLVLGLLGALGGPVTLFKGLDQMKTLSAGRAGYTAAALLGIALVKLAALLVAGTSGFRGGRIFPALFVGVAVGLAANALVPDIPPAIAVATGALGILMAVTRSGWLSLFMAAVTIPDLDLLPILTIVALPAWLLCSGRPVMQITAPQPAGVTGHRA